MRVVLCGFRGGCSIAEQAASDAAATLSRPPFPCDRPIRRCGGQRHRAPKRFSIDGRHPVANGRAAADLTPPIMRIRSRRVTRASRSQRVLSTVPDNRQMTERTIPRVTFDTNVCNVINNPTKWPTLVARDDAQKIRTAISNGRIAGFVSEATLFVECLSFPDKLIYLSVAGTPDPRPAPDPRMVAIFDDLAAIGIELLHAPMIGAEKFVESFNWAQDVVYSAKDRHDRFCAFVRPLPR